MIRRQLQSLLGKLLYSQRCVPVSHAFVNRLLNKLCMGSQKVLITEYMRKDIGWFIQFLVRFNGKVLFPGKRKRIDVFADTLCSGLGA